MTRTSATADGAGARARDDGSVGEQATRWLLKQSEGPLSAADARAFAAWLAADPEHERQFRARQAAWGDIPHMRGLADIDALMAPTLYERVNGALYDLVAAAHRLIPPPMRWAALGGAVASIAVALVVVTVVTYEPTPVTGPTAGPAYATRIAEIRDIVLEDGSTVTLGAASSLDVAFTVHERRVVLAHGEAFFDVHSSDPGRPFVVVANDTVVRVLGTKFDVHLGADAVRVAVLEGQVEVMRPDEPTGGLADEDVTHVLTAGQKVVAARTGKVRPVRTIDTADVAAWRDGLLVYVDTPLKDIIGDLNRYHAGEIELADRALGELPYTAAFQADQVDSVVSMIAASLELDVATTPGGRTVLTPRPDAG